MKKLLPFVIMSLFALKGIAKGDTTNLNNIPFDTATGKVSITKVVYADTMSKKWLYQKAMDWITLTYNNPQKAMNADGGKIMLKGNFMQGYGTIISYTMYIYFKDGRCRIKLTDIYHSESTVRTMEEVVKTTEAYKNKHKKAVWTKRIKTMLSDLNSISDAFSSYIQKAVTTVKNTKDDW